MNIPIETIFLIIILSGIVILTILLAKILKKMDTVIEWQKRISKRQYAKKTILRYMDLFSSNEHAQEPLVNSLSNHILKYSAEFSDTEQSTLDRLVQICYQNKINSTSYRKIREKIEEF